MKRVLGVRGGESGLGLVEIDAKQGEVVGWASSSPVLGVVRGGEIEGALFAGGDVVLSCVLVGGDDMFWGNAVLIGVGGRAPAGHHLVTLVLEICDGDRLPAGQNLLTVTRIPMLVAGALVYGASMVQEACAVQDEAQGCRKPQRYRPAGRPTDHHAPRWC